MLIEGISLDAKTVKPIQVDDDNHLQVDVVSSSSSVGTSVVTKVASSATNVTLKVSNSLRLQLFIFNDSTNILYVKFGQTASLSDYTLKILAGGFYELPYPVYTGRVDGIWDSVNGNAYITEMTS